MESIDKLREHTLCYHFNKTTAYKSSDTLADEIEAEIERDYMRLPVDADGVPIHVGDSMSWGSDELEVLAVGNETFCFEYKTERNGESFFEYNVVCSCGYTHFKPRTLEDVLVDMLEDAIGYSDAHTDVSLVAVEKYADEIRELLGGDAE